MARKALALIVVVDFLAAVVLEQQAIISRMSISRTPPHVQTFGEYAVTVTWAGVDDVDLYVRDPNGGVAWYASPSTALLHLEHDDLGIAGTFTAGHQSERTILRTAAPGEYVANLHLYQQNTARPAVCDVQLWELRGRDRMLLERTLTLTREGEEQTVFRFTLDATGEVHGSSTLAASLLGTRN